MAKLLLILAATAEDATAIHTAVGDGSQLRSFEDVIREQAVARSLNVEMPTLRGLLDRMDVITNFLSGYLSNFSNSDLTLYILDPRFGKDRLDEQALRGIFNGTLSFGYASTVLFYPREVWLMDRDRVAYAPFNTRKIKTVQVA